MKRADDLGVGLGIERVSVVHFYEDAGLSLDALADLFNLNGSGEERAVRAASKVEFAESIEGVRLGCEEVAELFITQHSPRFEWGLRGSRWEVFGVGDVRGGGRWVASLSSGSTVLIVGVLSGGGGILLEGLEVGLNALPISPSRTGIVVADKGDGTVFVNEEGEPVGAFAFARTGMGAAVFDGAGVSAHTRA